MRQGWDRWLESGVISDSRHVCGSPPADRAVPAGAGEATDGVVHTTFPSGAAGLAGIAFFTHSLRFRVNPKEVLGQMRHSRISTSMDIYAQYVPESQRQAVEQTCTCWSHAAPHSNGKARPSTNGNWNVMERKGQNEARHAIDFMVELVGIEPTTSSLRTMRSPS